MPNVFDTINVKKGDQEKSYKWYQDQIKDLGTISGSNILRTSGAKSLTNNIVFGNMYLFLYDPKHKETLPYYDRLPLVLPFNSAKDGFLGINLHYLPYLVRFRILGALTDYAVNSNVSEKTRIQISWKILSSSARLAPVTACVKHYLFDHVKSRFLKIRYNDWITASQLPIEQFAKAKKTTVWNETRKKYT
ncbi:MAG: hypothetical protein EBU90_07535 [Proteobacteria bacterium]|nr:hypothetical protein [Pseudomonadota bacterium]NBP13445.1 hypothetical protein [bacterium]